MQKQEETTNSSKTEQQKYLDDLLINAASTLMSLACIMRLEPQTRNMINNKINEFNAILQSQNTDNE